MKSLFTIIKLKNLYCPSASCRGMKDITGQKTVRSVKGDFEVQDSELSGRCNFRLSVN